MTGIFFLVVVGVYVFVISHLVSRLTRGIRNTKLQLLAGGGAFLLLMALPLADEIVGAFQFNALCKENAVLRIDEEKVKGKSVRLVIDPVNEVLPYKALVIYHSHYTFSDVSSKEKLAEFDEYVAKGGWFVHALGISNSNPPILIQPAGCTPPLSVTQMQKEYSFAVAEQYLGEQK